MKKDNQTFIKEVKKKNNKLDILEDYKDSYTHIKVQCKRCLYVWSMLPSNILKNRGCPKCANNILKTHDFFINELLQINKSIKICSEYKNSYTKIKCYCLLCSNYWETKPTHLLGGSGCPYCTISKGENTIRNILIENNIDFLQQYRFKDLCGEKNSKLSFDFYVPHYNLLIEFQGEQHRRPDGWMRNAERFKIQIRNDNKKRQYAKSHNINLLEIWFDEDIEIKLKKYI